MTVVSDTSANADEKIERAARVLRSSKQNKETFIAIYTGKTTWKTVEDIRANVSNFNTNTYRAAARLASEDMVDKKVLKKVIYYGKKDFYIHNRDRILKLSENGDRLKTYPTKRKRSVSPIVRNYTFRTRPQAEMLTIDDIESFELVRKVSAKVSTAELSALRQMPERTVNKAICKILNQDDKKDWGGERNDIYTHNVLFKRRRRGGSFALKGKATQGVLTPEKMGAKADQVQRLFEGTAELHFIVYHSTIGERVLDQMEIQSVAKSVATGKKIYYCPIDGNDLARLRIAYSYAFKKVA